jgi:hypothetical protein
MATLRTVDRSLEQRLLIAEIVSTDFIAKTPFISNYHFGGGGASTLHTWCRDFYAEYNAAPGRHIMDIYLENFPDEDPDNEDQQYMSILLTSLNGEWEKRKEELVVDYLVKNAVKFCNLKNAELRKEDLIVAIEARNDEEVERVFNSYQPISLLTTETGEDPFNDPQGWEDAFDKDQQELLFELPGVWGEFMGEQLYRESLIGILAPEKTCKSFMVMECGNRALRAGRNVALFEAGDMTKSQRYHRQAQNFTGLPRKRKLPGHDFEEFIEVEWPLDFQGYTEKRKLPNLTKELALEAIKKQAKIRAKRGGKLRQAYYTTSSLTFVEIERKLGEWKANDPDFIPDVILIDYPDIMAPENPKKEVRHQEGDKWKIARHLSQKYHACVIMCTQADADSYGKEYLSLKNFSETKNKYGQVTAFIGLNRTTEDESLHQIRINYVLPPREGAKHPPIKILQCLACAQPYLKSDWVRKKGSKLGEDDNCGGEDNSKLQLTKVRLKAGGMTKAAIAKEVGLSAQRVGQIEKKMIAEGELED